MEAFVGFCDSTGTVHRTTRQECERLTNTVCAAEIQLILPLLEANGFKLSCDTFPDSSSICSSMSNITARMGIILLNNTLLKWITCKLHAHMQRLCNTYTNEFYMHKWSNLAELHNLLVPSTPNMTCRARWIQEPPVNSISLRDIFFLVLLVNGCMQCHCHFSILLLSHTFQYL